MVPAAPVLAAGPQWVLFLQATTGESLIGPTSAVAFRRADCGGKKPAAVVPPSCGANADNRVVFAQQWTVALCRRNPPGVATTGLDFHYRTYPLARFKVQSRRTSSPVRTTAGRGRTLRDA